MENRRIVKFQSEFEGKKIDIELKLVRINSKLHDIQLKIEKKIRKSESLIADKKISDREKHIQDNKLAVLHALSMYIYYHDTLAHDSRLADLNHALKNYPFYKENKISSKFSTTKSMVDTVKELSEKFMTLISKLKYIKEDIENITQIHNKHTHSNTRNSHVFFQSSNSDKMIIQNDQDMNAQSTLEDRSQGYSVHYLTSS